jgi:LacI family transcriptional regulator
MIYHADPRGEIPIKANIKALTDRRGIPPLESRMDKKVSEVKLAQIAREAGVSRATVSLCLRNKAGPGEETRSRVLKIAQRLGYVPDAKLTSMMARIRDTRPKDFLPIAWLNTHHDEKAWHYYKFMSPYLEGARERCGELGYRIEEIWTRSPHMTPRKVSQILDGRGIEGVIIGPPASEINLNWENRAGVALGTELLTPRLHRIRPEAVFNFLLSLNLLRQAGFQRIGVCLSRWIDQSAGHVHSGMIEHLASKAPKGTFISPLFLEQSDSNALELQHRIQAWVKTEKPRVIVTQDNRLLDWLADLGVKVPEQIGVFHLAIDDDVLDWAGIISHKREQGRAAAELVISLVQNRQFGVPKIALDTTVRGIWSPGKTLRMPKKIDSIALEEFNV